MYLTFSNKKLGQLFFNDWTVMKIHTILFIFVIPLFSQNNDWQTYYEKSGFKETPRYAETVEYCQRLADSSPMVYYTTFGRSPQGRELPL